MLLADSAQVSEGKLYVLGAGWSVSHGTSPMALAVKVELPWEEANKNHSWTLELISEDNEAVMFPGPDGPQPLRAEGSLEVGRPSGLKPGTPLDATLALNVGPLPLSSGRYIWRFSIDGETREDWQAAFTRQAE
jgi:hypothetical protein